MSIHRVLVQPEVFADPRSDMARRDCLAEILHKRSLIPVFQPIIDLRLGGLIGYEGLIRGPLHGPLHMPVDLFRVAAETGRTTELEILCCQILAAQFVALSLPGKLFLNISPASLSSRAHEADLKDDLARYGLAPSDIVFELTEHSALDSAVFYKLLETYRRQGFQLAIDDLGEGYSSLRRWSEARPDFVKVDMYFIKNIHLDALKQQVLRSIRDIARASGALVIAEGVETPEELEFLTSIDIRGGQGFYIGRPGQAPRVEPAESLMADLQRYRRVPTPVWAPEIKSTVNAGSLLRTVPQASPEISNDCVCELFDKHPQMQTIPVVDGETPVGMISRDDLIGRFARPYQRELYGRRSCTLFMDANPPMADHRTSLQQLGHMLIEADHSRLVNDFIITSDGRYLGIGTTYDLLRELTQVQIMAAKHANPLTQLPGNVPLNLQIEQLLASSVSFCACYADLDHFKPFNDTFGYIKGDEIIQITGRLLVDHTRSDDFVGHIGGDDFLVLWCSPDWEARCHALLRAFETAMRSYLLDTGLMKDASHDGYFAYDRAGSRQYFNWPSISLGAVKASPSQYETSHQIGAVAAQAKALAKNIRGNSLHIERRHQQLSDSSAAWAVH